MDSLTTTLPQQYFDISKWNIPKDIQLSDENFNHPEEISILLGADVYCKSLLAGLIHIQEGIVLQNTLFGYVVAGDISEHVSENSNFEFVTNFAISDPVKLENVMENFWLSERMPETAKPVSNEFQKAEKSFQESMTLKDNRFYVDYPLVSAMQDLQLGDSFSIAYQRFLILEKRFKSNPLLLQQYKQFIEQYLELGHAKEVDISQYDPNNDPCYFLAHHAVINAASKTTTLRVVFDGSMKSKSK
ncbi:hypothetical protein NE865_02360 [Phthorimaea operculella]|nr:hypothetical protein NE865_02360 [Phthorimaea operculella]